MRWSPYISDLLITNANPGGTITNSDLELLGGLLYLEALTQIFDIRECTVVSKTGNVNALF